MTSTQTGRQAEDASAAYLKEYGYKIIAQNWRTRFCEIDIIAEKQGVIYFVEVKYRVTSRQGGGLDYITPAKLRQMEFAAEVWVSEHGWKGNYQLSAIEVASEAFSVTGFVESIV